MDVNTPIPIKPSNIPADQALADPLLTLHFNGFGSAQYNMSPSIHGEIPSEKLPYRTDNLPVVWNQCAVSLNAFVRLNWAKTVRHIFMGRRKNNHDFVEIIFTAGMHIQ